jgi:Mrp family chromosome partitioning ATPase
MAASDALVLGGWTDGTILIVQSGRAINSHVSDIIESFRRANVNLVGVVLNKVHRRMAAHYYYYHAK